MAKADKPAAAGTDASAAATSDSGAGQPGAVIADKEADRETERIAALEEKHTAEVDFLTKRGLTEAQVTAMPPEKQRALYEEFEREQAGPSGQGTDPADAPSQRVICTHPGLPTEVDGVGFATVQVGARKVHVSARMPAKKAERLIRVGGYLPFTEDEGVHGKVIDEAVEAALAPKKGAPQHPAEIELREDVAKLQASNLALAKERNELRARNEQLITANEKLSGENAELKARLGQS